MALTYDQVDAITQKGIDKMLSKGVFKSNAVLSRFRSNQEKEEGGTKITKPLMSVDDTGSTGAFYSSREALSLDENDGLTASEWDWKYVYESIMIYKSDIAKNAGRLGVLKLVDSKLKLGEMAIAQRVMKAILTGDGVKEFVGLNSIVAASGTVGGIAPADLAHWVSTVDSNGGTPRALTQAILDGNFDNVQEQGIGGATFGFSNKGVFTKIKGLLTAFQRTTRESSLDGFGHKGQSIVYNGIDYMVENNLTEDSIYHIDENHLKLHVHKDHDMRRQSISELETSDASLNRIFMYAALCCAERKFQGKIEDITT